MLKNNDVFLLIKERVDSGMSAELTVTGVSMAPLFRNGATVVELKAPRRIKKYDIALYTRPDGKVVLHRVVRVCGDSLWLRGDAEVVTEKGVPLSSMAAVAVCATTNGKKKKLYGFRHRLYGAYRSLRRTIIRVFRHRNSRG